MKSTALPNNPFTPTFGSVPASLAGRRHLIEDVLEGLGNAPGDPHRACIFTGARGTGKTVLLTAIAAKAQENGWVSVNVTSREGMLAEVMVQARDNASHLLAPETSAHLTSLQAAGFAFARQIETRQSTWRSEMTAVLEELEEHEVGLLITVDEASAAHGELAILVDVFQHWVREGREAALLLAGLPHNISLLLRDDSISFLRRTFQYSMERIAENDISQAFLETVEQGGRTIGPEALALAAESCGGFAFMIQLVGYHSWRQHPSDSEITANDVTNALKAANRDMTRMVLEPTIHDLTVREEEFLRAMALDDKVSSVAAIAKRMGVSANNAAQIRRRLLERGIIGERGRGRVGFDVPLLRDHLRAD